ncbi:MAG TPA: hypothetical protein PLB65_04835 [Candidatus Cloacimonas sp.]|nr:hypothetical protein [Candidatus Cloacimonas sp.]
MKMLKIFLWSIMLSVAFFLFADNEADSIAAYSIEWKSTGSNAVIDSVFTIDVTAIPDTMTYKFEGNDIPIPDAQTGDGIDNSQIIRFDTSLLIVV